MTKKAKVLIVTPFLGAHSEVWLWRQLIGFRMIQPSVLAWQHVNRDDYPLPGIKVETLDLDFNKRVGVVQRMANRILGLAELNFCGPSWRESRLLHEYLAIERPEVVLCHFGYTALRILPVIKSLRIPMVVHFHGRDLSASLQSKRYRWSLKQSVKYFSSAVVVGSHQRKKLTEEFQIPDNHVHLIPCGVPTDEFTPGRARDGGNSVRFVSVSRLSEEKGLSYSLQAFAQIVQYVPNTHLTIIGDGPMRDDLEHLVEDLGLGSQVTMTGRQSPKEIIERLRSSDIFIQHSIESVTGGIEGFGVTIAEASSVALPVVVTDCGGIVDQVVDGVTGYVVPQKNIEVMAERMLRLARDAALRKMMGQAGRLRMTEHFDTRGQIAKLENVLLNCCRE